MKIIKLTADNVKRLKAVEITPQGTVQVITGRNAQGKSSVLDAIWLALSGGEASRKISRPVRDGEEKASVTLDLGDLVVERKWSGDNTTLTVKAADGAKYSSPQAVLDKLVGKLSFDPLEFTRLSDSAQVTALLDLVDLDVDLDAIRANIGKLFDERKQVGRDQRALGREPKVDTKMSTDLVSVSKLLAEVQDAHTANWAADDAALRTARAHDTVDGCIADLKAARKEEEDAVKYSKLCQEVDVSKLETKLEELEETNQAIRDNNEARALAKNIKALSTKYDKMTAKLEALDKQREDALAKAKFPVEGLSFDEDGVLYNNVPFSQASSAEQIRVSLAMAMALNPELRVIRVMDGSLLDEDNMALLTEMATTNDYQVWVERVSDDSETAVVIEDGSVV